MAKAKSKRAPRKRTAAKAEVETILPVLLSKGSGFILELGQVVQIVKAIEKHRLLNKFISAVGKKSVRIDADSVNEVKKFLSKHKMYDRIGKHILAATDPQATQAPQGLALAVAAATGKDPFRPCTLK